MRRGANRMSNNNEVVATCGNYEPYSAGYKDGRLDERQKIIELLDSADDAYNAMFLLGRYLISKEIN